MNKELVLGEVVTQPVDMIITGQYFYATDFTSQEVVTQDQGERLLTGFRTLDRHFQPPVLGGPMFGDELSEHICSIKPEMLVLRYSLMPDSMGRLVGDIPKQDGPKGLVEFIDNPVLPEIIQNRDWARLRKTFPKITFYETLERDH